MPDVLHKFSSAIADGGDATLVRPSNWNDDHTWPHAYNQGHLTLLDGQVEFQVGRLIVSSTNRVVLAGTSRVFMFGWLDPPDPSTLFRPVGFPKIAAEPFRLPDGYELKVLFRLSLRNNIRGVLEGTSDIEIFDDFGTSRIVLTGVG